MDQAEGPGPIEQPDVDSPPVRRIKVDKGIARFPKQGTVDEPAQDKGIFHFLHGDDIRQASGLRLCPNHRFPDGPGLGLKPASGPVPASPGTEFLIRFSGPAVDPVKEVLQVPAQDDKTIPWQPLLNGIRGSGAEKQESGKETKGKKGAAHRFFSENTPDRRKTDKETAINFPSNMRNPYEAAKRDLPRKR